MKIQLSRQSRKDFKKWKKANGQLKKRNLKAMEFNQKNPDKKQMNYESELEPAMVVKVYLPVNALRKNSMFEGHVFKGRSETLGGISGLQHTLLQHYNL